MGTPNDSGSVRAADTEVGDSDPVIRVPDDGTPVESVPINVLAAGESPRLDGVNAEYVSLLVETDAALPPILVHRPTMRVIDGMHRLQAATKRGERDIDVRFFSGDEGEAFVLAVSANIAHGLPLSFGDRTAAALRIMRSFPQWSDRAIADVAHLAHRTVGEIRRRATGDGVQSHSRIGRDGRIRPLDNAGARRLAGELIIQDPNASLRKIAKVAGTSPSTVRDVRDRVRRGEDPLTPRQRGVHSRAGRATDTKPTTVSSIGQRATHRDPISALETLRRDPSLRFSNSGRALLRLLDGYVMVTEEAEMITRSVPLHCTGLVADAARAYAKAWQQLAESIERAGRSVAT